MVTISSPLHLRHQRHRLTVVSLSTSDSELHILLLQRRATGTGVLDQENLVQLALDTAHERPEILALGVDGEHHLLALDLDLRQRDQLGALGQLVPRGEAQARCAGRREGAGVVVQEALGGVAHDGLRG